MIRSIYIGIFTISTFFTGGSWGANNDLLKQPLPGLTSDEKLNFLVGQAIFEKIWVFAPSSTTASDGLGPLYNARSCLRCHVNNGRGQSPVHAVVSKSGLANGNDYRPVSLFLRLSIPPQTAMHKKSLLEHRIGVVPEPTYGGQLQVFAYPNGKSEGHVGVTYLSKEVSLHGGETVSLMAPSYRVEDNGYGALHSQLMVSPRITPPIIGLGLLDSIADSELLKNEDINDADKDGVSGKANRVWNKKSQSVTLGRFGWKAGTPSVEQQNNAALSGDLGISNWMFPNPHGDCTQNQRHCLNQPHGNTLAQDDLEASKVMTDLLFGYVSNLAPPKPRDVSNPVVLQGEDIFKKVGCANCHVPEFVTSKHENAALSEKLIRPYSDLLLHDMGPDLADNRPEYDANGREWRTPPLWGIGLTSRMAGEENYLHDGRARTLLEAILWHGGEAESSKNKVVSLSKKERESLIRFLKSL